METCDFCSLPVHLGACPELLAYVATTRARLIGGPCRGCGDTTRGDYCAACREVDGRIIESLFTRPIDQGYVLEPWPA